jgi:hypothetical protein
MSHSCPYCDRETQIDPADIVTDWAFARCEGCSGTFVLRPSEKAAAPSRLPKARPRKAAQAQQPAPGTEAATQLPPSTLPAAEEIPAAPASPGLLRRSAVGIAHLLFWSCLITGAGLLHQSQRPETAAVEAESAPVASADTAGAGEPDRKPAVLDMKPVYENPIHVQPASPVRESVAAEAPPAAAPPAMIVTVRAEAASFRAGPGLNYRKVGAAKRDLRLSVRRWEKEWLQVEAVDEAERAALGPVLWIRNDLVSQPGPAGGKESSS